MQSFSDLFANNRLLAIGIVLAAIAVILAVGVALFRLIFGRRLHMSGGRTRQPRLGVVDAFDLDRQRQLVLIRRDNVEHLLMIGGPNDVLVEAAIVRAPAMLAGRDKDASPSVGIPAPMAQPALAAQPAALPALAPLLPNAGLDAGPGVPVSAPLPLEPRPSMAPDLDRAAAPAASTAEAPPAGSQAPAPAPETRMPSAATLPPAVRPMPTSARPVSGLPPRPPVAPVARPASTPTPRTNLPRATPTAPPPAQNGGGRQEPALGRQIDAAAAAPAERDRAPADQLREAAPQGRAPTVRVARGDDPAASPNPRPTSSDDPAAPAPGVTRPLPRPAATMPTATRGLPPRPAAPIPTSAAPAATTPRAPLPSLGSLEEEMAKLLGRPMPPPDQSGSGS